MMSEFKRLPRQQATPFDKAIKRAKLAMYLNAGICLFNIGALLIGGPWFVHIPCAIITGYVAYILYNRLKEAKF